VSQKTAWAWVHGGDKQDAGGVANARLGPDDVDRPLFEGLTERFQRAPLELRKFV